MEEEKYWYERISGTRPPVTAENATPVPYAEPPAHGCEGGDAAYTTHFPGPDGELPLHFIGIYEAGPRSGHAGRGRSGEILIRLERPGKMVLALSAYARTRWRISAAPEVELQRILLTGYEDQSVDGVGDVPVEKLGSVESAYRWPSVGATVATRAAEKASGATLASFRGCYRSEWFFLAADEHGRDAPGAASKEPPFPQKCGRMVEEPAICIALHPHEPSVSLIGLQTGAVCTEQLAVEDLVHGDTASLGWDGDHIYFCAQQQGVVELDLKSGAIDVAPIQCGAVTSDEGGALYVGSPPFDTVTVFASFADAKANRRHISWSTAGLQASRFAVHGGRIYAAWHSTDKILRAQLPMGAKADEIPLVGYNGWILGLDALDDRTLVVAAPAGDGGVRIVDIETGQVQKTIAAPDVAGIKCRTAPGFTLDALKHPGALPSPGS